MPIARRPTTSNDDRIARAVERLAAGEVVVFPTETVYGLGADATNPLAVARVFEVKGRPRFDPLIVHVATQSAARDCVTQWPESAAALAERFWPGPLTLVLSRRSDVIPDIVTSGLPAVALRIPDHPMALELLTRCDTPLAAPSANRFGSVSPTTAEHVRQSLGDVVDFILDGGPCSAGIESTIISLAGDQPVLLRPGATPIEEVETVIGVVARLPVQSASGRRPLAPGMLERHYATRTPILFVDEDLGEISAARCGRLVFAPPALGSKYASIEVLSPTGDLREAASNLFAAMRRLDALDLDAIIADRFPTHGLGLAINDRLARASAR